MKTKKLFIVKTVLLLCIFFQFNSAYAQSKRVAVFGIDGRGSGLTQDDITVITRMEIQKLDGFVVLDKYDVEDVLKANNIVASSCFSTDCLIKAGELVKADIVITGSLNPLNNNIVASFRLIDVARKEATSAIVREYANIAMQTQNQISLTVAQLLDKPYDKELYNKLKRDPSIEQQLIQPSVKQLNLSGPRMGFAYIYGNNGEILKAPVSEGGFNVSPLMFQIGYQFEQQYLNSGTYQALIEFVPMVTGIDQNKFIPSLSLIHGLRNNDNGWEFGIGAVFSISRMADMFYNDGDKKYHLLSEWRDVKDANGATLKNAPQNVESRLNSTGDPRFNTGVILAVGKSFKSGTLNIPVAIFVVPQSNGGRVGVSIGFNSKK